MCVCAHMYMCMWCMYVCMCSHAQSFEQTREGVSFSLLEGDFGGEDRAAEAVAERKCVNNPASKVHVAGERLLLWGS